jgi:hypothetical protein
MPGSLGTNQSTVGTTSSLVLGSNGHCRSLIIRNNHASNPGVHWVDLGGDHRERDAGWTGSDHRAARLHGPVHAIASAVSTGPELRGAI